MTDACTEWLGVPFESMEWKTKANVKVNEKAHENFRKAVSQLITDEAGDEAKAR